MIKPRDYQIEALQALKEGRQNGSLRQLVALPTGAGKTIVAAYDLRRVVLATGKGAIFMAHRDELITQPIQKIPLVWDGVEIGRVKAESNQLGRQVTVASVQTIQHPKRLQQLVEAQPYSILYVDEAHHATSDSYKRIIQGLTDANPYLVIVGLTATPVRADGTRMSEVFTEITYQRTMLDLIEAGYLSDLELQQVPLEVSLDGIPRTDGDLKPSEVRRIMVMPEIMHSMVEAWKTHAAGKRTIAFGVDVEHAQQLAATFVARGVKASVIYGDMAPEVRRKRLIDFQAGKLEVIVNCQVLCLDSKTEILTDRGWTGMNEMTFNHKVANYEKDTGEVTFENPLEIVRRPRGITERMVSLETPRRSIRVTEGHRMIYRTLDDGKWHKTAARDLAGRQAQLPVSTVTPPIDISIPDEPPLSEQRRKRLISSTAYNLRKLNGFGYEESFSEAAIRIDQRYSLRRTQPRDLTTDDCEFIGFWLGDGGVTKLQSGGVEYKVFQAYRWPAIIKWIDALTQKLGFNTARHEKEFHVSWSLCRGTGRGCQKRDGVYRIEPYLDKSIPDIYWALSETQFDALLHGLWMADGNHGCDGTKPSSHGFQIYQAKRTFLEKLQAIAVCRGWRATLRGPDGNGIHTLSLAKTDCHRMTKYRLQAEEVWIEEQVWCVKTRTSNLITRRNGSVTFMGNTEGFDDIALEGAPPLSCIMLARPTLSQSLYIQQIGRGLRPSPGKEVCTILDFAYNSSRHHIVQLPHLFGMEELPKLVGGKKKQSFAQPQHIPSIIAAVHEARKVDFRQPPPRAGFRWAKSNYGFALSMSGSFGFMLIRPVDEASTEFNVFHIEPPQEDLDTKHDAAKAQDDFKLTASNEPQAQVPPKKRMYKSEEYVEHKLTSKPLSFEWAFGLAEDTCRELYETRSRGRKMAKSTILDRDADWLAKPPTEQQVKALSRVGKTPTSRGEATNMITCMIVERIVRDRTPATPKQLKFLRWKKAEVKQGLTKGEATRLISKIKSDEAKPSETPPTPQPEPAKD